MMNRMKMTKHAAEDRIDRLMQIATTIGFGKEVLCVPSDTKPDAVECLTDTGVIIIKSADKKVMITAYVATIDRVFALYKGKAPQWMIEKVRKAQKKFKRG